MIALRTLNGLLPSLSAGWLSIAALYAFDVRPLPEPAIGFALATAVAVTAPIIGWAGSSPADQSDADQPTSDLDVQDRLVPEVVDTAAFDRQNPDERQCPHCGGFDVAPGPDRAHCLTCGTRWVADRRTPPDVVVRSFLH